MKKETETTEVTEETTGAGVIAPIVATAAAIFAFWCWENTARFVNAISLELPLPCGVRY